MLFNQDRDQMRRFFVEAWRKRRENAPMEPLEVMVADIVAQHPEYHGALEAPDSALEKDYLPELGESNPFLHMGMHIAIQEQLSTDRPAGIKQVYQQLVRRMGDVHHAEHAMMECLAEMVWQAQRSGTAPDELNYLECLHKRL